MTPLAAPFAFVRRDDARWTICFAAVLLAHAAVALALFYQPEVEDFGVDAPVVTILLPPGPNEEESEATPPPKEETKPPEQDAEVALPEPRKPEPPQEHKQATTPAVEFRPAAARRWESALVAHIEHFKRYPADARARGETGLALVAFSVDREGWVRTTRLVQSSGYPELDQEALAMLTRAQPVPRPPDRIPASELTFTVPLRFSIR